MYKRLNGKGQKQDRSEMDINYSTMEQKKQAEMELVSSSARRGRITYWQSIECRTD